MGGPSPDVVRAGEAAKSSRAKILLRNLRPQESPLFQCVRSAVLGQLPRGPKLAAQVDGAGNLFPSSHSKSLSNKQLWDLRDSFHRRLTPTRYWGISSLALQLWWVNSRKTFRGGCVGMGAAGLAATPPVGVCAGPEKAAARPTSGTSLDATTVWGSAGKADRPKRLGRERLEKLRKLRGTWRTHDRDFDGSNVSQ